MRWWSILVEDLHGIQATHVVQTVHISEAMELERQRGYRVICAWEHDKRQNTTKWGY